MQGFAGCKHKRKNGCYAQTHSKIIEYKGEYTAMREARHHAAYYTKGIRGGAALRKEISTFEHFEQLEELAYKIAKENE